VPGKAVKASMYSWSLGRKGARRLFSGKKNIKVAPNFKIEQEQRKSKRLVKGEDVS